MKHYDRGVLNGGEAQRHLRLGDVPLLSARDKNNREKKKHRSHKARDDDDVADERALGSVADRHGAQQKVGLLHRIAIAVGGAVDQREDGDCLRVEENARAASSSAGDGHGRSGFCHRSSVLNRGGTILADDEVL